MDAGVLSSDLSWLPVLGTLIFCGVFLLLWRHSGVAYFGLWSLAWGILSVALFCGSQFFHTGHLPWLAPYAFLEFAFALFLVAAARMGMARPGKPWMSPLRLLLGFPLFLLLVMVLNLNSRLQAYSAVHALVLGGIYLYNYLSIEWGGGMGTRLFRFTLLCLMALCAYYAMAYFILIPGRSFPSWARFVQYNSLYDFALHMLLAFAGMAMWIEHQHERLQLMGRELDAVRRESLANMDLDRLTGLLNQSALAKRMEEAAVFSGVVAVCDMDNFKDINDRYGHLVGDEILRNVGNLLRTSIRTEDEAFRWGGDEFVILFHRQSSAVASSRMEMVQQRLQFFRVRGHQNVQPISFSWGTAEGRDEPLREILDRADHEMYNYKRHRASRG